MALGVPLSELVLLASLIILAGLVTGILAGLFGIGGGALIVPVLYEVFRVLGVSDEVRFQLCVGTSIAIIKNREDRKSTRLNSSHLGISYAVFCLKKKNQGILPLYLVYIM